MPDDALPAGSAGSPPSFITVAEIRDPDGLVGVITERAVDGKHSFAIFREWTRNGVTERSIYKHATHIPAYIRLLTEISRRIEPLEQQARHARASNAQAAAAQRR